MYERTIKSRTIYEGRIVTLEVQDVELENGTQTIREIVRRGGAAVVVARLPDGRFILVRQYRKAVDREVLELVAGILDEGEEPAVCARRELKEETGHDAARLVRLGRLQASPGYTDEFMEVFFADLDGEGGTLCMDHDEHVTPVILTRDEVVAMIRNGEIQDAKTVAGWALFEHHEGKDSL